MNRILFYHAPNYSRYSRKLSHVKPAFTRNLWTICQIPLLRAVMRSLLCKPLQCFAWLNYIFFLSSDSSLKNGARISWVQWYEFVSLKSMGSSIYLLLKYKAFVFSFCSALNLSFESFPLFCICFFFLVWWMWDVLYKSNFSHDAYFAGVIENESSLLNRKQFSQDLSTCSVWDTTLSGTPFLCFNADMKRKSPADLPWLSKLNISLHFGT